MAYASPSYLHLTDSEWKERIEKAISMLEECRVCPHQCGVNRLKGELGYCKTGRYAVVDSFFPHRGEEKPIRGRRGSGTVFFSYCNMKCVYCQNYPISQLGEGKEVTPQELADAFLTLQKLGCHNINLVTPSHVVPQILEALYLAVKRGLRIPIVYNTSSYDSVESLQLLEGIVDIYLADLKYADDTVGKRYSKVKDYFSVASRAVEEMYRQVGDLVLDEEGVAVRGVLIRHLVLPNDVAGTQRVMEFIRNLSPSMAVNVMSQYRPYYKAYLYPEIARPVTGYEMRKALDAASGLRLILE
ncbi:Radical SAM domain protein [Thermocrinis albus DSM 14484]|uniref:Radical SAM domain protein n=1 Tax=Thermocrinis albus (strain DSM 14484 / JCM 11386 / HI 11/12) TaxID=638303 RepID=D3SLZ0_THEAH|nr:radical SAM protein [Thermocrinis albus]ADC89770.1 Radical SAM domain protein [Thermocrinis albus DSM 14484]